MRLAWVIAVFALVGCGVLRPGSPSSEPLPPESRERFELARRLVAERKESEAVGILRTLLELHPDDVRVHREYQDVRIRMGEEEAVRTEYRQLAATREDGVALLLDARLEPNAVKRRAGIEAAIERDPDLPWAYYARGVELARDGKLVDARDEFHRADRLARPLPEARLSAGETSLELGDYAAAIEDLTAYLDSDPEDVNARFDLASALASVGKTDEARAEFARVLELEPRDRDARLGLGNALLRQGRVDEALAAYEEVAREDPTNPEPYYNIGILYESYKGDVPGAVAAYRKFLELGGKESLRVSRWIQRLTGQKP